MTFISASHLHLKAVLALRMALEKVTISGFSNYNNFLYY